MSFKLAPYLAQSVTGIGVLGGIVGGAATLAKNARLLQTKQVTPKAAAIDTGKETVGAGVATAFSAVAAGAVGGGLAVSLGVAVVAGVAAKYLWDAGVEMVEKELSTRKGGSALTSDDELLKEVLT